jgi:hypothetical protein
VLVFQQSPDNYDLSKLKNTIKIIKNNKVIDDVNDGSCEEDEEDEDDEEDDEDDEEDDEEDDDEEDDEDEEDDDEEDDDDDDEDDDDDDDKTKSTQKIIDTPCTFRLWKVINGLPLIINGEILRGHHLTTVHYNKTILDIDGEAGDEELGGHLLLEVDGFDDIKLEAESIEDKLAMFYVFDHSTKTLIHEDVLAELEWELRNEENNGESDDESDSEEHRQWWKSEKETTEIDEIMYYVIDNGLYDVVTEKFVRMCEL